jgi:hypothetical protein
MVRRSVWQDDFKAVQCSVYENGTGDREAECDARELADDL